MLRMYDFSCTKCGHKFEQLVDDQLLSAICPKCDGHANRTVSAASIKATGVGVYDKKMRV